jgi:hypothetical protein
MNQMCAHVPTQARSRRYFLPPRIAATTEHSIFVVVRYVASNGSFQAATHIQFLLFRVVRRTVLTKGTVGTYQALFTFKRAIQIRNASICGVLRRGHREHILVGFLVQVWSHESPDIKCCSQNSFELTVDLGNGSHRAQGWLCRKYKLLCIVSRWSMRFDVHAAKLWQLMLGMTFEIARNR